MLGSVLVRSLILPTLRVSVANELRFRISRLTTDLTDLCHRYTFAERFRRRVMIPKRNRPVQLALGRMHEAIGLF